MKVRITRLNGYRSAGISALCGEVIEVDGPVGNDLIAWGVAEAVTPAVVEVEHVAPVLNAIRNGAYKKARKK